MVDAFIRLQKLFHTVQASADDMAGRYKVVGQVRASATDQVVAMSFIICQPFQSVDAAYVAGKENAETWVDRHREAEWR